MSLALMEAGVQTTLKDQDFSTTCPTCTTNQTLAEASFAEGDAGSVYTCRNGCQPILVVASRDPSEPARGWSFGDYEIRNPADLIVRTRDAMGVPLPNPLLLEASPTALD